MSSSSDPSSLEEEVLVLFASQTGNSEQAALDIARAIPEKLSSVSLKVTARSMQLDDFLELHDAQWTRLVVIVCSSYGVGQAPLGGYRFRDYCDTLLQRTIDDVDTTLPLKGLTFALLGLGDSKYTTFFKNPTITNNALEAAGATRVGALGKADASSGSQQLKVIEDWIADIWPSLKTTLEQRPSLSQERLKEMQHSTIDICRELDPDFMPPTTLTVKKGTVAVNWTIVPVFVAVLGVVAWYFLIAREE